MKPLTALLLLPALLFAQAPVTATNPFTNGVPQPTVTAPTVTGGVIQSPITVSAGTTCGANPQVTIFSDNGSGSNTATATATCTGGTIDTSVTVTNGGTTYQQGHVFLVFNKALWKFNDDHAHSIQTGGNSPTCKTACAFACSNYASMSLSEKLGNTAYTSVDPGVSCRTVTSSNATSCPVYNATTWAVGTVTNSSTLGAGAATHIQVTASADTLYNLLSTNNAIPTPLLIGGTSTGLTVTPTINGGGASNITSLINTTNFPWYAKNVTHVAGVSVDFDLYYWIVPALTGTGNFNTAVVTTGTPGGSPTIQMNGCGSVDNGTDGTVVITIPGYENAVGTDTNPLYAQTYWGNQSVGAGAHHSTALNVSGAPVPLFTNDWVGGLKYALDNPAPGGSPSLVTFSHSVYSGAGWSAQQLAFLGQLVKQYPGQVHMQVVDAQTGGFGDTPWDYILSLGLLVYGNASGDSYNVGVQNGGSGIKSAGVTTNIDSATTSEVMNSLNNGRSYFWRLISQGTVPRAIRCAVPGAGTTITCRVFVNESNLTSTTRMFMWIGEGGKLLRVTSSAVSSDTYTLTGAEGKYVRVIATNIPGNTYAQNVVYVVGKSLDVLYYTGGAGGLNDLLWTQPFWINYGGVAGSSSTKVSR